MENLVDAEVEVVFVYIGEKLPKYALDSIRLASESSGGIITLLGSRSLGTPELNEYCHFIAIEDFYDPKGFIEASSAISSSHDFRGGFWLKSLERFYVLHAYMRRYGLIEVFHAELDQLLFNVNELVSNLRASGLSGIFVPSHSEQAIVASILYCNNESALASFLRFPLSGKKFPHEMGMLADWCKLNPENAFILPTLASELNPELVSVEHLPLSITGGLVDAAQLGQWVAGIDPKNVPILTYPKSKFVDAPHGWILKESQLRSMKMSFIESTNSLFCSVSDKSFRVYNLHIHSKIHSTLLKHKPSIKELIESSNLGESRRFKGTLRVQVVYFISIRLSKVMRNPGRIIPEVTKRLNIRLGRRPSSKPFLSGDTFRKAANHVWESQSKDFRPSDVNSGDIVFCESELFGECKTQVLSKLDVPFTLILGNSDLNHDAEFENDISGLSVSKIFAQNMVDEIPRVTPLPIGLENRWRANHGKVSKFGNMNTDPLRKTFRIMSTFSIGTNPEVRGLAHDILSRNPVVDTLGMISPREHRKALSQYAFIACPPGNGLDTHRTWESMYRGSIPIVLNSYMNRYFKSLGLPLMIVNSYTELENISEKLLKEIYLAEIANFGSPALWFDYWEQRLN